MDSSIIEVKGLVKKFKDIVAVNNISFEVKKGDIFAFLGPNGAGKTTTIKILTTLLDPTSGEIKINGFDVVSEQNAARKSFGIVFQDPSLDDELTAQENLDIHAVLYGIPNKLKNHRSKELLDLVNLTDRKDKFVKTFSGGMKRRLEIAKGLLHHPKILFLDEPTLGLDPQTRQHIWNYISELNQKENVTIFFTTHYIEEADKMARNVAIIDHGQIIAQGSPLDLRKKTNSDSLETAFLKITGCDIREENGQLLKI